MTTIPQYTSNIFILLHFDVFLMCNSEVLYGVWEKKNICSELHHLYANSRCLFIKVNSSWVYLFTPIVLCSLESNKISSDMKREPYLKLFPFQNYIQSRIFFIFFLKTKGRSFRYMTNLTINMHQVTRYNDSTDRFF